MLCGQEPSIMISFAIGNQRVEKFRHMGDWDAVLVNLAADKQFAARLAEIDLHARSQIALGA